MNACLPIHDRVQALFDDARTNDAARTLDMEYAKRITEYTKMWDEGLIATYEYVNHVINEASKA
jgi:hypothetical protein